MKGLTISRLAGLTTAVTLGISATMTHADLMTNDPVDVDGTAEIGGGAFASSIWGSNAPAPSPTLPDTWTTPTDNGTPHLFGGLSDFHDATYGTDANGGFPVTVTSGLITASPYEAFITLDMTAFVTPDMTAHDLRITGIKPSAGLNVIDSVTVTNSLGAPVGSATFTDSPDGWLISWSATGAEVFADPVITITWTQALVPGPGSMALLCMAGLIGVPRRRKHE